MPGGKANRGDCEAKFCLARLVVTTRLARHLTACKCLKPQSQRDHILTVLTASLVAGCFFECQYASRNGDSLANGLEAATCVEKLGNVFCCEYGQDVQLIPVRASSLSRSAPPSRSQCSPRPPGTWQFSLCDLLES